MKRSRSSGRTSVLPPIYEDYDPNLTDFKPSMYSPVEVNWGQYEGRRDEINRKYMNLYDRVWELLLQAGVGNTNRMFETEPLMEFAINNDLYPRSIEEIYALYVQKRSEEMMQREEARLRDEAETKALSEWEDVPESFEGAIITPGDFAAFQLRERQYAEEVWFWAGLARESPVQSVRNRACHRLREISFQINSALDYLDGAWRQYEEEWREILEQIAEQTKACESEPIDVTATADSRKLERVCRLMALRDDRFNVLRFLYMVYKYGFLEEVAQEAGVRLTHREPMDWQRMILYLRPGLRLDKRQLEEVCEDIQAKIRDLYEWEMMGGGRGHSWSPLR